MKRAIAASVLVGAALACGGSDASAPACADVLPACPASGPPSYAATIAPLVAATCLNCHAPGGEQASMPFETYAHLHAQRSAALNQIHACQMPPIDGPQLTEADRQTLETWFVCGAPEN